jgi:Uma2 family endonuclease
MPKEPTPNEQRIVLTKISWQKYEALLAEMGASRATHLTYDRGRLELMTPLPEHERSSKLVESLLLVISDELRRSFQVKRPWTLKSLDLQQAVEPDLGCFLDLSDPAAGDPPDLVMEIALTRSDVDKLPLYASFGVPEVWRYVNTGNKKVATRNLRIYHLQPEGYIEAEKSLNFPFLPASTIVQFLDQSDTLGLMPALRLLRDWLQNHP